MTPSLNESQIAWTRFDRASNALLFPAVLLMVVAVVGCSVLLFGLEDLIAKFERPYLIPWVLATGLVIVAPLIYFKRRGTFTFANPIIYPSLVYFLPVFFIGGWSLVFGWSHYPYLNYVADPEWNFPLAFVYVMLGIGGLALGFMIPTGKKIGGYFSGYLPSWDFKTGELIFLGAGLLPIGFYIVVSAIEMGTIGYQGAVDGPGLQTIGSLSTFFTFVIPACQLFLWIAFFRIEKWNRYKFLVLGIQLAAFVFFNVATTGDPVTPQLWQSLANIALDVLVAPWSTRVVNTDGRVGRQSPIKVAGWILGNFPEGNSHAGQFPVDVNTPGIRQRTAFRRITLLWFDSCAHSYSPIITM